MDKKEHVNDILSHVLKGVNSEGYKDMVRLLPEERERLAAEISALYSEKPTEMVCPLL